MFEVKQTAPPPLYPWCTCLHEQSRRNSHQLTKCTKLATLESAHTTRDAWHVNKARRTICFPAVLIALLICARAHQAQKTLQFVCCRRTLWSIRYLYRCCYLGAIIGLTCSDLQSTLHWLATADVAHAPAADINYVERSCWSPRQDAQLHSAGKGLIWLE